MAVGSKHIPYRGSKLTQVMKEVCLRKTNTVMLATVAPSASQVAHTLDTLRSVAPTWPGNVLPGKSI